MHTINVGVIGCGYWGPNLIRNLAELPMANLRAVADLKADRLAHIKSRYPAVKVTADYRELFAMGLDAVVVATPPATHYRIARDCLEHGLAVLVEKPLALNTRDAVELIKVADRRELTLMVGHTFEYNLAVRALKGLIDSGELGQIYYVDAVRVSLGLFQPDLNVLWDLAPHDISILLYLFGCQPAVISAQGANCIFMGKPDVVYVNLEFPNQVMAHIRVSWLDPCKVRRITVVGSRQMVVYDDVENVEKIKIYDKGVEVPPYTDTFAEFECSYRTGNIVIPCIGWGEPLRLECQHFVECVANHTPAQSDGRVGLRVVQVLEAAERSMYHEGMPEIIDYQAARDVERAPSDARRRGRLEPLDRVHSVCQREKADVQSAIYKTVTS